MSTTCSSSAIDQTGLVGGSGLTGPNSKWILLGFLTPRMFTPDGCLKIEQGLLRPTLTSGITFLLRATVTRQIVDHDEAILPTWPLHGRLKSITLGEGRRIALCVIGLARIIADL